MHTLHLSEFAGYDNKEIYANLLSNNENSFRIILKRNFMRPNHDILEIAIEYFNAIQLGQALAQISPDFSYNVPSERSSLPFIFECSIANREFLAHMLVYFLEVMVPRQDITSIRNSYHAARATFLHQYLNDNKYPGCHGLIYKMDGWMEYDQDEL